MNKLLIANVDADMSGIALDVVEEQITGLQPALPDVLHLGYLPPGVTRDLYSDLFMAVVNQAATVESLGW